MPYAPETLQAADGSVTHRQAGIRLAQRVGALATLTPWQVEVLPAVSGAIVSGDHLCFLTTETAEVEIISLKDWRIPRRRLVLPFQHE